MESRLIWAGNDAEIKTIFLKGADFFGLEKGSRIQNWRKVVAKGSLQFTLNF